MWKDVTTVFEKNLNIGYLLDFYGDLLSDRKRSVMEMYYNEDLSLAEIAQEIGISRQGVHETIKKSEDELLFYEEKLGLAKRLLQVEKYADKLVKLSAENDLPNEIKETIDLLTHAVRQDWSYNSY